MSATLVTPKTASGGEIIRELSNSSDGQGLHFDGASGTYVNLGDTTVLDGATKISLEAIASTSGTSMGTFISKSSAADCINLRFNADGKIFCALNNGSSTVSATTSGAYNDGNLRHIVATWDNATISIYVNGNLDGTATLAGGSIPNTADRLALGANVNSGGTTSNNFNGSLYRARIYNKALTQAEVDNAYQRADVDFADQYGSQTALITGNNSTFSSGLGDWATGNNWNSQTNPSNNMALSANAANQRCYISVGIETTGQKYRFGYDASSITGTVTLRGWDGSGYVTFGTLVAGTGNTIEFDTSAVTHATIYIASAASGDAITVDNLTLVQIGCTTDLDLAFSNPSQSLMIQDRAGVADGTASAGVSQTQKIVQLNSTSARIGTTAATPADGEVVSQKLTVNDITAGTDWNTIAAFQRGGTEVLDVKSNGTNLQLVNENTSGWVGVATGSGGNVRLKIDSAGQVGLSATPNIGSANANNTILTLQGKAAAYGGIIEMSNYGTSGNGQTLGAISYFDPTTSVTKNAEIEVLRESADDDAKIVFKTKPTGGTIAARMTISSAGVVTVGSGHTATLNIDAPTHDGSQASQAILNFKYAHSGAPSPVGYIKLEENAVNSFDGTLKFGVPYNNGSGGSATREAITINEAGDVSYGAGNSKEATIQSTNSGRVEGNPAYSFRGDLDTGMFNPNTDNTLAFSTGGTERMRISSAGLLTVNGNVLQVDSSPEYFFGTTNASHYNWRLSAQQNIDGGFEIGVGTQSAGSSAATDTYATKMSISSAGLATFAGGIVTSEKGVLSGEVTVADDAITTITPARQGGFFDLHTNSDTGATGQYPLANRSAKVFYDCGSSPTIAKVTTAIGADVDVTTSDVSGTSGTDGKTTISSQGTVIKIENRSGSTTKYFYTITC